MGLLNNLFGGKPRKTVQDERFGEMILFRPQGTASIWAGKWELSDDNLEFFISGDEQEPAEDALQVLEKLVAEPELLGQAKAAVIETLRNADEGYAQERFESDMALAAISVKAAGIFEISYVQRHDPYYHFNVAFEESGVVGVSIDS